MGQFSRDVDKFIRDFRRKADKAAQFYCLEAGLFIVSEDVTPVITGTLVGGWYMLINSSEEYPKLPPDPSRVFTRALMKATAKNVRWGDRVEIVNNVFYGIYVDQGTFRFEGRHMIARTIVYLKGLKPPL